MTIRKVLDDTITSTENMFHGPIVHSGNGGTGIANSAHVIALPHIHLVVAHHAWESSG